MKTRRNKRGGRVLGEGVSAFVVDPAIPCKDGRSMKGYVSRVSKTTKNHELMTKVNKRVLTILKKIDPTQKYFYYPEYCVPGKLLPENIEDGVTEELKKYSEILPKGEEAYLGVIYRSRNWKDFFRGRKRRIVLKELMHKMTEEQQNHLRKGIELLHSHKVVHGDLHFGNVIIGNDNLPRVIDFARSLINPPKVYYEQESEFLEHNLNRPSFSSF